MVTPVELMRNQLMMQIKVKRFGGPREIFLWILRRDNYNPAKVIRGVYRGLPATLLRDGLAVPMWFLGFHLMGRYFLKQQDKQLTFYQLALAGSTGGILFWAVALPFDQVKSIIQAANIDKPAITLQEAFARVTYPYRGWQVAFGRVSVLRGCKASPDFDPQGIPGAATTLTVHHIVYGWLSGQE